MALLMLNDALERQGAFTDQTSVLEIAYFPYARQDRVANHGESLSAYVMADLINNMCFDKVRILDPHSDVVSALVESVEVVPAYEPLVMWHPKYQDCVFVIPDAGAEKKTRAFAERFGNTNRPLQATKIRCTKTGRITSTALYDIGVEYDGPQDFVIVDDICDGGRTFIELAKVIRSRPDVRSLHLHVSHGIFSKGIEPILEHFDTVSTTDSLPQVSHPRLEVFPAF
jgi:ribose-phosphate pyrophosphokinase